MGINATPWWLSERQPVKCKHRRCNLIESSVNKKGRKYQNIVLIPVYAFISVNKQRKCLNHIIGMEYTRKYNV